VLLVNALLPPAQVGLLAHLAQGIQPLVHQPFLFPGSHGSILGE
jgi:hypothetical protein